MINLSELEKLAENHIHGYLCTDVRLMPHTLMALIRVARAAISVSQHHAGKSVDELKEALKEFE